MKSERKSGDESVWRRTWEVFHSALEKEAGERESYVAAACADQPGLRTEVDRLLAAHRRPTGILNGDPLDPATVTFGLGEGLIDARIGPYHLREIVGEGGMGVVYSAEQTSPVRRRVALKLIRPGLDSREVVARFESERQALAIMDHPRIAKVHDAGVTETGRPYFVMEYVPGIPINEYCDMRGLGLPERLELFSQACEAIDHAHRKGVIHRDIKPSNLLVAAVDGKPSLKVIDFGVAKAMNQPLTERTLFTRQGALVGTPGYISPEQAGTTPLEVDARTDVYALGVVLYELLVGAQPFDPKALRNAALAEMLRIIREEDPPPPWARVTSLGAGATEVARKRALDVHALVRRLRGELEWITMRALDKDAERRYASAADLALDIERHLAHRPVEAGPPTLAYRTGKFLKRHGTLAIAASIVALIVVGLGGMLMVQSDRLADARRHDGLRSLPTTAEGGVVERALWRDAGDIMGSPTPDGRQLSFTDWTSGDLAMYDFESGEKRRLTSKNSWATPEFAEFSVVSPDGGEVAYAWYTTGGESLYELRVVSTDDPTPRILASGPELYWLRPLDWTPDGRWVLAWIERGSHSDLTLIRSDGGEQRTLMTWRGTEQPGRTEISPDGRALLYSDLQQGDTDRRDIFARSIEDGTVVSLVEHSANDIALGWTPDGRHVLFASDRTGSWGMWAVPVTDRGPVGSAELIKPGFGGTPDRIWPMGFTSTGSFVYGFSNILTDVQTVPIGRDGRATDAPRKVTERFEGTHRGADWSADGSRLAWISEREGAFFLVFGEPGGGKTTEVAVSPELLEVQSGLRWSPDGSSFLITGRAKNTESWQGIFEIEAATGKIEQIAAPAPNGVLRAPRWHPDGRTIYFERRSPSGSAIVALDTGTLRETEVLGTALGTMALSPDARFIAYTTDAYASAAPGAIPALSIVPVAGGEVRTIFESDADRPFDINTPLEWSPDGEHLYFATGSATQPPGSANSIELLRIPLGGGPVVSTGIVASRLSRPRISPDGSTLAFDTGQRRAEVWSVDNLLEQLEPEAVMR